VHQEKGPYRTIQAALSEALDGDIISVSPGVYAEQLRIERDNVRIVGKARDGSEVVLECSPQAWTVRVDRDAGNYRLENIVFRQNTAAGEVEASAAAQAGIATLQDKVKRNMFALAKAEKAREQHDSNQGGFAAIVARGRLTFLNCTLAGPCGGVLITGSGAESLLFGCRFTAVPAGSAAVQVEERARARVAAYQRSHIRACETQTSPNLLSRAAPTHPRIATLITLVSMARRTSRLWRRGRNARSAKARSACLRCSLQRASHNARTYRAEDAHAHYRRRL